MFQVVVTGDAFVEVVGHQTDKHTLRKPGNLARRNERVHLRVDGGGHVLPVDGDRLPLLQYISKPLRKRLCRKKCCRRYSSPPSPPCHLSRVPAGRNPESLKAQTRRHPMLILHIAATHRTNSFRKVYNVAIAASRNVWHDKCKIQDIWILWTK